MSGREIARFIKDDLPRYLKGFAKRPDALAEGRRKARFFGGRNWESCEDDLRDVPQEKRAALCLILYFKVLMDQAMHAQFPDQYPAYAECRPFLRFGWAGLGRHYENPLKLLREPIRRGLVDERSVRFLLPRFARHFGYDMQCLLAREVPALRAKDLFERLVQDPDFRGPRPADRVDSKGGKFMAQVADVVEGELARIDTGLDDLQITVDGTPVTGRVVYLSDSDLSVRMTAPYPDITSGWHVPYFAMPHPPNRYMIDGRPTDRTLNCAVSTLEQAYRNCKCCEDNLDRIREKYDVYLHNKAVLDRNMLTDGKLKAQKQRLRKKMKVGEMTPVEYGRLLKCLRKQNSNHGLALTMFWSDFVDSLDFLEDPRRVAGYVGYLLRREEPDG